MRLGLIFFVLACSIGLAGYQYYDRDKSHITRNKQNELLAIADLKISQITQWRKERINGARALFQQPFTAGAVRKALAEQAGERERRHLLGWMQSLLPAFDYRTILLVNLDGSVQITTDARDNRVGQQARDLMLQAFRTRRVFLSDFHLAPILDYVHLDLIVPVFGGDATGAPLAAFLIRIDPDRFLYPLIQTWPAPSASAETLVVRRSGDYVLFLNELRHRVNTALTLSMPLTRPRLPAAQAVLGAEGIIEGLDYRGVPVMAAIRQVPDTPWRLIAKIDLEEIYAPMRARAWTTAAIVGMLIVATGLLVMFWWWKRSAEFHRARMETELARRQLSQKYESLAKYANDIVLLIDENGRIVEANDRAVSSYGYSLERLLTMTVRDIRTPQTQAEVEPQMQAVRDQNGLVFESTHLRKDGSTFPVEVSSRIITIGKERYFQSIIRDITERKAAEQSLRDERNRTQQYLDVAGTIIVVLDREQRIVLINRKGCEVLGYHEREITGANWFDLTVPTEDRQLMKLRFADALEGTSDLAEYHEHAVVTRTGQPRLIAWHTTTLRNERGDGVGTLSSGEDITERKRVEDELRANEERYRRLVQSVTDYIYTVTLENGRPVKTTHGPGSIAITGYTPEEYDQDPYLWHRMIFEEDRAAVVEQSLRVLSGSVPPFMEHRIIHKNGSLRWVRSTLVPRFDEQAKLMAYDGMVSDITDRKQLELQLRQAQKMEAVGQLAGGIAHDFNNILTAIIGYGNLILMKLPPEAQVRSHVEQILASSERAAQLTHNLLAFGRKQIIDLKSVNLNTIIGRVEKILTRLIGEDIEIRATLSEGPLIIRADSVQVEQILMNLVTNARDAMPGGGTITIETSSGRIDEEYIKKHGYGKPGAYAVITVTDTGSGMDEATLHRIFEPFFTTKEQGKGTGLGLAMVYGIVKQHNGFINVSSQPGRGTTFTLYLPEAQPQAERASVLAAPQLRRGTETILLAEDDTAVRKLEQTVLKDFGYRVIEATDGRDALEKFTLQPDAVDLIILDIIMPRMSGKEAYDEIRRIRPDIKALFTSGYTTDVVHRKGFADTEKNFILKPISPSEFLNKVREILDL